MKNFIVAILAFVVLLVLFSFVNQPGPHSKIPYFNSDGCHYVQRTNFMGNHIYVCPKKK